MKGPWWNQYVGIPYVPRGRNKHTGLDCYGLLITVYREQYGIEVPDYAYDNTASPSPPAVGHLFDEALSTRALWHMYPSPTSYLKKEGDVAVFSLTAIPFHTGILLPREYMLHCVTGAGVVVEHLTKSWTRRLVGVYVHEQRANLPADYPRRI